MRNYSTVLAGIGVVAGIVGVGILVGWWGSRRPVTAGRPPVEISSSVESNPTNRSSLPASIGTSASPASNAPTNPVPQSSPVPPPAATTTPLAAWEQHVDQILGADTDDTNKVQQLFQVFPGLPEDGQIEVAQHLSNLVADEDYAPLGQLLQNAKLPEPVLDVLMGDVLNRPNAVKLPTLLEVARNPDHVEAAEAKDLLELYLDEDYGTNWDVWRQKMQEWLKENPD
jgi:hypothetical protein